MINANASESLPDNAAEIVVPIALLLHESDDTDYWDYGSVAGQTTVGGDSPQLRAMREHDASVRRWAASCQLTDYQAREILRTARIARAAYARVARARIASAGVQSEDQGGNVESLIGGGGVVARAGGGG